ncbi:hypothetical protein LY78DRAFT_488581 [Colletotrichum sublineola]|nr:hypothetical protein LY78DRAFT_488581 [Colletotrichum sublineola]
MDGPCHIHKSHFVLLVFSRAWPRRGHEHEHGPHPSSKLKSVCMSSMEHENAALKTDYHADHNVHLSDLPTVLLPPPHSHAPELTKPTAISSSEPDPRKVLLADPGEAKYAINIVNGE